MSMPPWVGEMDQQVRVLAVLIRYELKVPETMSEPRHSSILQHMHLGEPEVRQKDSWGLLATYLAPVSVGDLCHRNKIGTPNVLLSFSL